MDVDGFILSQKSKLADEKSRLAARDRKPRGIIPTESSAILRNNRLREERHQEYNHYMEEVGNRQTGRHDPPGKSVAEIRHDLSLKREKEISQNERKLKSGDERDDYSSNREKELSDDRQYRAKRLAEERRYRDSQGQLFSDDGGQKSKSGKGSNERQGSSKVTFVKDRKGARYSSWDEEEEDLMKWTRNQAYKTSNRSTSGSHRKAQTPPGMDSPRLLTEHSKASLRSISAPSVAAPAPVVGIAALGANDDDSRLKRLRQLKYAEELRNQIEEKKEENLQRGPRIKEVELGYTPAADKPSHRSKYDVERFNEESGDDRNSGSRPRYRPKDDHKRQPTPPYNPRKRDVVSPDKHRHHRYSDYEEDEDENRTRRKPRQNSSSRYGYYYDPYGHPPPPPPPPPRYQGGGYNRWGAPYYPPYPPPPNPSHHEPGYHTPYADIYFPPYHPHHPNPYAPPPRESRPPSREYWENRGREKDNVRDERKHSKGPPRGREDKENAVSPMLGVSENKGKLDKDAYRQELEQQMREKKERDLKEKAAKEKYEKKVENEIYDPFGKGGCGAPVRDQFGNLVADLKQMRKINENRLSGNSPINLRLSKDSARENPLTPVDIPDISPRNTILTYDKQTTEDMKKVTQESYRDYLRQQVKEKEELKQKEKERQKLEEQKELEQLERDRKRLQEEYQQELERQRKKEEEARNKNEAIKREAELKRQMAIMQREEEERKAQAEKRLSKHAPNFSMSEARRADSPPVPALRKMKQLSNPPPLTPDNSKREDFRSSSPPVPALRKKKTKEHIEPVKPTAGQEEQRVASSTRQREPNPAPVHRESSATQRQRQEESFVRPTEPEDELCAETAEAEQRMLLTQLGAIRMHLQAELAKQTGQHQSDIFEKAKQQKPKIAASRLLKPKDSATLNALGEFNKLKYGQSSQQRSGKFYEDFPGVPEDEQSLEAQQSALIRHQSEMIKAAQQRVEGAKGRGKRNDPPVGPSLSAQTAHLDVNSSGIPLDGDILENIATRRGTQQQQNQARGHWKDGGRGVSPTGSRFSVSTQDVDGMAARNEERLQRLEAILNAGGPGPRRQPSSVSNHFLAPRNAPRTRTESRQSERSLQCEVQHLPTTR